MRGIRFSFPSVTQDIVVTWSKVSAPSVEVGRSDLFAPSVSPYTLLPADLEPVNYIFRWYTTDDGGATLQTLLTSWPMDGRELIDTEFEVYEYVVGRGQEDPDNTPPRWYDPVAGSVYVYDERLTGRSYAVERRGVGTLRSDEIEDTGHGFQLITAGDVFSEGETLMVMVSTGRAVTATGAEPFHLVSAEETAGNDYWNTHNVADFDGLEIATTTLPLLATIPDGKTFEASTYSCPGLRYWILQLSGSDAIEFMERDRDRIILGVNERIKLVFKNIDGTMVAKVVHYEGRYPQVGEVFFADNKNMPGAVLADGTEYDIADYPRLLDEVMQQPERIVASTPLATKWNESVSVTVGQQYHQAVPLVGTGTPITYYPNRGKFVIDEVSSITFRVPDERGQSFRALKNFDGTSDGERLTQGSGGRQAQQLIEHYHSLATTSSGTSISEAGDPVRGSVAGSVSTRGKAGSVGSTGGTEQRVDNTGKYALIYI